MKRKLIFGGQGQVYSNCQKKKRNENSCIVIQGIFSVLMSTDLVKSARDDFKKQFKQLRIYLAL